MLHLLGKVSRWDGEFKKEKRGATSVVLQAEADAAFAVAEEGACNSGCGGLIRSVG